MAAEVVVVSKQPDTAPAPATKAVQLEQALTLRIISLRLAAGVFRLRSFCNNYGDPKNMVNRKCVSKS